VWAAAYRLAARAWAAYLARGEHGASAYLRGSIGTGDWLPGLADVDLALVLPADSGRPGAARQRASARWRALRRRLPVTDLVLDYPLILEEDELREVAGRSALTFDGGRTSYLGAGVGGDALRMLERPGLYGTTTDWRPLAGPRRLLPEPQRDAQERRIAAWLELVYWWQWAFPVCADPSGPRTASLCVKLVAEPARIWLWLAHGERAADRSAVLEQALRRLPEEEAVLRRALELQRALPEAPSPPLAEVLPGLLRLSSRVAGRLAAEVPEATEVRLAVDDLVLTEGGWRPEDERSLLALCDWRSLVWETRPDETFSLVGGDPADPAVLAATAQLERHGTFPALRSGELMLFPSAIRFRSRLRAVHCPLTAPIPFALAGGSPVARFPVARGWSAADTAARAVAEHRAWLEEAPPSGGEALGRLLTAARAALFLEDPGELPVTASATARRLAARSSAAREVAETALGHYGEWATRRTPPPPAPLAALRALVLELDAYRTAGQVRSAA
jgi:Nucleotidyltransferase domain